MLKFHDIYMPQFNKNRVITVYLPPSYASGNRFYSVVYMQDGQNLFNDEEAFGGTSWRVGDTIDRMPIYKQAIVVGIHNGEVDRIDEYTPFKRNKQGGKGADYLRFIVETLKPFIDNNYRTLTPPEHTWLVGSSLGGLISLFGGLLHPSVFGKIGVMSPSIWFNPKILQIAANGNVSNNRFYFVGSKVESRSMEADLQKCYWRMKELGLAEDKLTVLITNKGKHNEMYWRQMFKKLYLELIK
jgi:predicted alpha/beta superfamily hydrolase